MRHQAARVGRGAFEAMAESKMDVELMYAEGKEQGVCVRWHKSQRRELFAKGGEITEQGREEE